MKKPKINVGVIIRIFACVIIAIFYSLTLEHPKTTSVLFCFNIFPLLILLVYNVKCQDKEMIGLHALCITLATIGTIIVNLI